MKFIPRMLCLFLAMHAAAGTCTASYEVGLAFNYRSDDAIFPKMRECFLEEYRKVTSFIETRQLSWKFAEDVKAELERLEHISFAGGRAKAKEQLDKWLNSDWAKKWWTGEPDL